MFLRPQTLLHIFRPIERLSSKLGRKAGIYHLPWIRIDLELRFSLLVIVLPLSLMAMACQAMLLFYPDLLQFPCG